jgi:hypothetical protein
LENDVIDTDEEISLKYAEILYKWDTKYVRYYLKFLDRSEKIAKHDKTYVYKIKQDLSLYAEKKGFLPDGIDKEMNKYNDIKPDKIQKINENMKKYFNLQWYKI